jgi:DNA-directed RNA polymerase subunit M/transcription elongation factor TFIIS
MKMSVIECPTCGATITAEEISAGQSLTCPKCEEAQKASKSNPKPTHQEEEKKPSPSLRPSPGGSCGCGHGGGCC